ncbi:MAG: hypothetical protein ABR578_10070 [Chromatocurvus sp.]
MSRALAENPRTATKAAIKRASARARTDMNHLDARVLNDLDAMYRRAAANLQADIEGYADGDGSLRLEVLQSLLGQVNTRLGDLRTVRDQLLDDGLLAAAQLGVKPFDGVAVVGDITRVANEAAQFVRGFQAADGLQLSDRLWRIDAGAREQLGQAIQSAVIQGHGASRAVNDFLARGQAVPPEIAAQARLAQASGVAKRTGAALLRDEGNARAQALRVFRTELNRAHGEAYQAAAFTHPDVIGTRFLLSPRHPEADICDMHASANPYGLGRGVYPPGRNPWPAHPNTLSYTEVVFADEVTDEDRAGQTDRIEWLKQQPAAVQSAVLGGEAKRGALNAGLLNEGQIATPWRVLRERFAGQGIDVGALSPLPVEPLPVAGGGVSAAGAAGAPVADALEVRAHKVVAARVLAAIDRVHRDGALPRIPLTNLPANTHYYGAYSHEKYTGRPVKIGVRAGGDHKDLTLAHEIGHFLDHHGAPGNGFSSKAGAQFADWRRAVDATEAVRSLRALRDGPSQLTLPDGVPYVVNRAYIDYLLSYEETWARSYAQWIARESGEPILQQQLSDIVAHDQGSAVVYSRQWAADDFDPVAEAIGKLMRALGWT